MKRVLLLDEGAQQRLEALRRHAEANVKTSTDPPVGDDPRHVVKIEKGWTVIFSVEDHGFGPLRHVSVSVQPLALGMAPNPDMVAQILPFLGYRLIHERPVEGNGLEGNGVVVFPSAALGFAIPHVMQPVTDRACHEEGRIAGLIFHEHLDAHEHCRNHPFDLCRLGSHLLRRVTRGRPLV